ncbi:MBL fold metallo-hydrolase [Candidatus Saccharibacteria bacterium]|nr:MBL fold metallo-hydrolase [Candidatus Saccharibacteria bacterium]MBI3337774.1 MBL fold metallo-hydrolase [Candidatus Saccharibacteria bacterium]
MELQFYGANCLRVVTKKAVVTIDDNLTDLGLKSVTKNGDIVLFTGLHGDVLAGPKIVIDQPGEYEVSDMSIKGVAARGHIEENDRHGTTLFRLIVDGVRIVITGHVYPELTDEQLEALGTVDILCIPVGGNGYTLDPTGALKIIKKIGPKIIIPTHYFDATIKYPVSQVSLEEAIKELSIEPSETVDKLKLKVTELDEATRLVILERQ